MSENKQLSKQIDNDETKTVTADTVEKVAKKRRNIEVKTLCYTAVFVALSAATNILTFPIGKGNTNAISITYIPNFFAGAFLGPLAGFLTGLLGDLIGCWLHPLGPINPFILLASGLMGVIPGVIFKLFRKSKHKHIDYVATATSMVLIFAICTTINTFGVWLFYFKGIGRTLEAVFATRTATQAPIWAINSLVILLLLYPMKKMLKFRYNM